ncbi:MAG: alpha/beta hydrolase family protein, partial [Caulobacteraceae bacterium]
TTKIDWTDPGGAGRSPLTVAVGSDAQIIGFSDDLRYVLVEKSGPSLPPEYYLLTDGSKLNLLGRSRNDIDTASLGETRLVQYPARDGLIIPAFLTTPPASFGAGPHPAIILPHGGPWARDEWGWDVSGWTQYFASRGFVVMQPQFRGSQGWGQKLWRAGDAEWGQKMQDDNDDAAKWLVAQNLAAPGQAALFGYSYGGYAAMTAAIRPNGLYKCAIAGAGVAELGSFQNETFENRFIREFQMPTIKGLDPLAHAREVSIPIFLYHGERDQTVPIKESERFVAALKAANKPHKYREFKDMGHQFVTMVPEDLQLQLTEIEAYLHQDCGLHAP